MVSPEVKSRTFLDRDSPLPLYHQLKQYLLYRIHNGEIDTGEALPPEEELEEAYGVSRITVRRALGELVSAGFISRQPGRGTFVLPSKVEHSSSEVAGIRDDLAASNSDVLSRILESTVCPSPAHVARKLDLEEGSPLLYVRRLVFADGEPLPITTGCHNFKESVTFTFEELESDSVFRLLDRKCGLTLSRIANRTTGVQYTYSPSARTDT